MNNYLSQSVSKFLTLLFGSLFLFSGFRSGFFGKETEVPDDFSPILRFVVCSDIHLNGEENQEAAIRFRNLFKDMYAYAQSCSYKTLDAVVVAGDFTGGGAQMQYEMYNKIVSESIREETQLLTVLGNHEFIDYVMLMQAWAMMFIKNTSMKVLTPMW